MVRHLDPAERTEVRRRLRRAEGQLRDVITMLDDGRDCAGALTQLSAVTHALHRARFAMPAGGLENCLATPAGNEPTDAVARPKKLFLSLG